MLTFCSHITSKQTPSKADDQEHDTPSGSAKKDSARKERKPTSKPSSAEGSTPKSKSKKFAQSQEAAGEAPSGHDEDLEESLDAPQPQRKPRGDRKKKSLEAKIVVSIDASAVKEPGLESEQTSSDRRVSVLHAAGAAAGEGEATDSPSKSGSPKKGDRRRNPKGDGAPAGAGTNAPPESTPPRSERGARPRPERTPRGDGAERETTPRRDRGVGLAVIEASPKKQHTAEEEAALGVCACVCVHCAL